MKRYIMIIFLLSVVSLLSACMFQPSAPDDVVTVYSERHYDTDQVLYELFEKETGIKVQVLKANADELINRLVIEGEDTIADVLIVSDAGRLHRAKSKGLLQEVDSSILHNNIPSRYRDIDSMWFGLTKRARILVYNPEKVSEEELSSYEALTKEMWRGRIVIRSSTNIYNQSLVASFIAIYGEEYTRDFLVDFVSNFAREPEGNDRDQAKAVASGIADVAIINSYYMGKMANSTDPYEVEVYEKLRIFFPNQDSTGTHINVSGAGVTKYAKNKENAIALIEFLSSVQAQNLYASANYEYPVNPLAQTSSLLLEWGNFLEQDIMISDLGLYATKAAILMDEAGWK